MESSRRVGTHACHDPRPLSPRSAHHRASASMSVMHESTLAGGIVSCRASSTGHSLAPTSLPLPQSCAETPERAPNWRLDGWRAYAAALQRLQPCPQAEALTEAMSGV